MAREVARWELLGKIGKAVEHAKRKGHAAAILMLEIRPHNRLALLTERSLSDKLEGALAALPHILRPSDCYSRLDVWQICIVLPGLNRTEQATLASHKISRYFTEALEHAQDQRSVRTLIGIACYPDHADDAGELLLQADAAMSDAGSQEEGIYYSRATPAKSGANFGDLYPHALRALRSNDLWMEYQPKLNLITGRCDSSEALLRWALPDGKAIPPTLVIAVAEAEGKAGPLTTWVLNAALRQLSGWQQSGLQMGVSVNVLPRNLRDPDLPSIVARGLDLWGINASCLTLEIVESSMIQNFSEAASMLRRLKELGVNLSIDDFGTGYSSLAYLRQLPLDEMKIDRAFVRNLLTNESDRQLVQAMIDLAHNFKLTVVAEGVEDEPTLAALREMGCDIIQGWLIGRSMKGERMIEWQQNYNRFDDKNTPALILTEPACSAP